MISLLRELISLYVLSCREVTLLFVSILMLSLTLVFNFVFIDEVRNQNKLLIKLVYSSYTFLNEEDASQFTNITNNFFGMYMCN